MILLRGWLAYEDGQIESAQRDLEQIDFAVRAASLPPPSHLIALACFPCAATILRGFSWSRSRGEQVPLTLPYQDVGAAMATNRFISYSLLLHGLLTKGTCVFG